MRATVASPPDLQEGEFLFFLSGGCIAAGKAWAAAVVASWQDAADRQAKIRLSSPAD